VSTIRSLQFVTLALCLVSAAAAETAPQLSPGRQIDILWGEPTNGLRLGVSVAKKTFALDEPIMVRIALQNVSQESESVSIGDPTWWQLEVLSFPPGRPVPYTEEGKVVYRLVPSGSRSSVQILRLKPGDVVYHELWVNRFRDMTSGAKFTVNIGYNWPQKAQPDRPPVTVHGPPLEIEMGGSVPWHASLQALLLETEDTTAELYAANVGRSAKVLLEGLGKVAAEQPTSHAGYAAHRELLELRDRLEELIKQLPPLPKAREKAEAKPQPETAINKAEADKAGPKAAAPQATPETAK